VAVTVEPAIGAKELGFMRAGKTTAVFSTWNPYTFLLNHHKDVAPLFVRLRFSDGRLFSGIAGRRL
jgi:hypothetical protein